MPVKVPAPLITAAATGSKIAFAPFTFKVPPTTKLLLAVNGWVVLESVRLLNVMLELLLMLWTPEPLKLKVPVLALKVPVLKLKLPLTLVVLSLEFQVPPAMTTFVGEILVPIPLKFVQLPFVVTSRSPPIVKLVPFAVVAPAVEILLPAVVAELPENVIVALVLSNVRVPVT